MENNIQHIEEIEFLDSLCVVYNEPIPDAEDMIKESLIDSVMEYIKSKVNASKAANMQSKINKLKIKRAYAIYDAHNDKLADSLKDSINIMEDSLDKQFNKNDERVANAIALKRLEGDLEVAKIKIKFLEGNGKKEAQESVTKIKNKATKAKEKSKIIAEKDKEKQKHAETLKKNKSTVDNIKIAMKKIRDNLAEKKGKTGFAEAKKKAKESIANLKNKLENLINNVKESVDIKDVSIELGLYPLVEVKENYYIATYTKFEACKKVVETKDKLKSLGFESLNNLKLIESELSGIKCEDEHQTYLNLDSRIMIRIKSDSDKSCRNTQFIINKF